MRARAVVWDAAKGSAASESVAQQVIEVSIIIFDNLQRALKAQADIRNLDSDTDTEAESDEDDADAKPKKGNRGRKVPEHLSDDDDEIDEMTFDYIDAMTKDNKMGGLENDDEEHELTDEEESSCIDETDTEQFKTLFDEDGAPDVFVYFKDTMEKFEQNEPELFATMVANLTPQESESLHTLIKASRCTILSVFRAIQKIMPSPAGSPIHLQAEKSKQIVCEQHVKSEHSKQVEQAGGYNFGQAAGVPSEFNFAK
ncbi:unnamed protein product [Heligmosomoides polygyrus]|uniref:Importin-7 n=1 Tax=Heligmosomoides polygyrus TaxID=6339 RepID=A0A183GNN8_HELPZ|nr:unnamed protein product [Heligmosomoides polygyrus]